MKLDQTKSQSIKGLTCCRNAVKSNKSIEAGGSSSQGPTEAVGHKSSDSIIAAHIGRDRQVPETRKLLFYNNTWNKNIGDKLPTALFREAWHWMFFLYAFSQLIPVQKASL